MEAHKAQRLRGWLADKFAPSVIIDFSNRYIFEGVGITTAIVKLEKKESGEATIVYRSKRREGDDRPINMQLADSKTFDHMSISRSQFTSAPWLFGTDNDRPLIEKIDQNKVAAGVALSIGSGMQTGRNDVFGNISASVVMKWDLPDEAWFIRVRNSDIKKWHIEESDEALLYANAYNSFNAMPKVMRDHLKEHEAKLKSRAAFKRGNCEWWQYTWPLHADRHSEGPRIYCPYMATENRFALDQSRTFLESVMYFYEVWP